MDALWIEKVRDVATDMDGTRFVELLKETATGTNKEGLLTFEGKTEELSDICAILSAVEAYHGVSRDVRSALIDIVSPHIDLMKFLSLVAIAEELESDDYEDVSPALRESFKRGYSEDVEREIQGSCDEKFIAWIFYELDAVDNRYAASLIRLAFDTIFALSDETLFAYLAMSMVKDED